MAPLLQWVIQILLGATRTKDFYSSTEIQPQITHHTNDKLATSIVDSSVAVTAVSWGRNRIDVYVGPFADGSLGHKYFDGSGWFPSVNYENIGGSLKGPPLAISWGPNRNDVFAVGRDNQLWHKSLDGSTWGPSLSEWQNLGGNLSSNYPLAAVSRSADHLDVFGVREEGDGGKSLWRKSRNGASWKPSALGFEHIPGSFSTAPSVASRVPSGVSLYIVDLQHNLRYQWWDVQTEKWSPWSTIGTQFRSTPAAVSMNTNRSDILCIGVDGALYDVAWVNGEGWKEKVDLRAKFADIVSVQKVSPYEIDILGLTPDGSVLYKWLGNGQWSGWQGRGGSFISVPALASWEDNDRLDIFGIGFDGGLYHKSYNGASWEPSWDEWEQLAE